LGARSARHAIGYIKDVGSVRQSERTLRSERERIDGILARSGGERHAHVRKKMNNVMSENVFIFRNEKELQKAVSELSEVREAAKTMTVMDKSKTFNTDLIGLLETEFLVDISQTIALGALNRTESRGAQARTDFPDRDDEKWLVHTRMTYTGADPTPDYERKVTFTKYKPEVRSY
jgi:succinate dehydrogenase / fumarate reductase flavoprotein subunit